MAREVICCLSVKCCSRRFCVYCELRHCASSRGPTEAKLSTKASTLQRSALVYKLETSTGGVRLWVHGYFRRTQFLTKNAAVIVRSSKAALVVLTLIIVAWTNLLSLACVGYTHALTRFPHPLGEDFHRRAMLGGAGACPGGGVVFGSWSRVQENTGSLSALCPRSKIQEVQKPYLFSTCKVGPCHGCVVVGTTSATLTKHSLMR